MNSTRRKTGRHSRHGRWFAATFDPYAPSTYLFATITISLTPLISHLHVQLKDIMQENLSLGGYTKRLNLVLPGQYFPNEHPVSTILDGFLNIKHLSIRCYDKVLNWYKLLDALQLPIERPISSSTLIVLDLKCAIVHFPLTSIWTSSH